jgi:hypothetical protein
MENGSGNDGTPDLLASIGKKQVLPSLNPNERKRASTKKVFITHLFIIFYYDHCHLILLIWHNRNLIQQDQAGSIYQQRR